MVSTGGPVRRSASERSPPSSAPLILKERVRVSGLYCKTMTPLGRRVNESGSRRTIPPFKMRGDPGNALMASNLFLSPNPLIGASWARRRRRWGQTARLDRALDGGHATHVAGVAKARQLGIVFRIAGVGGAQRIDLAVPARIVARGISDDPAIVNLVDRW